MAALASSTQIGEAPSTSAQSSLYQAARRTQSSQYDAKQAQSQRGDRYGRILDGAISAHATDHLQGKAAAVYNFRDTLDEYTWQIDWIEPKVVFLIAHTDRYYDMLRNDIRDRLHGLPPVARGCTISDLLEDVPTHCRC
jgi:hypothetical protein